MYGFITGAALLTLAAPAHADEEDLYKPQFGDVTAEYSFEAVDELEMQDFTAYRAVPPLALDATGRAPLSGAFEALVTGSTSHGLVVDLPVVVASDRASFDATHAQGLLLRAEVELDGQVLAVVDQRWTSATVAAATPTLGFFRLYAPTQSRQGELAVRVSEYTAEGQLVPRIERRATFLRP